MANVLMLYIFMIGIGSGEKSQHFLSIDPENRKEANLKYEVFCFQVIQIVTLRGTKNLTIGYY